MGFIYKSFDPGYINDWNGDGKIDFIEQTNAFMHDNELYEKYLQEEEERRKRENDDICGGNAMGFDRSDLENLYEDGLIDRSEMEYGLDGDSMDYDDDEEDEDEEDEDEEEELPDLDELDEDELEELYDKGRIDYDEYMEALENNGFGDSEEDEDDEENEEDNDDEDDGEGLNILGGIEITWQVEGSSLREYENKTLFDKLQYEAQMEHGIYIKNSESIIKDVGIEYSSSPEKAVNFWKSAVKTCERCDKSKDDETIERAILCDIPNRFLNNDIEKDTDNFYRSISGDYSTAEKLFGACKKEKRLFFIYKYLAYGMFDNSVNAENIKKLFHGLLEEENPVISKEKLIGQVVDVAQYIRPREFMAEWALNFIKAETKSLDCEQRIKEKIYKKLSEIYNGRDPYNFPSDKERMTGIFNMERKIREEDAAKLQEQLAKKALEWQAEQKIILEKSYEKHKNVADNFPKCRPKNEGDIFNFETYVTGMRYMSADAWRKIRLGDELALEHEHKNEYDKNAVLVLNGSSEKVGYVYKPDNPTLARDLDSGTELYAMASGLAKEGAVYFKASVCRFRKTFRKTAE